MPSVNDKSCLSLSMFPSHYFHDNPCNRKKLKAWNNYSLLYTAYDRVCEDIKYDNLNQLASHLPSLSGPRHFMGVGFTGVFLRSWSFEASSFPSFSWYLFTNAFCLCSSSWDSRNFCRNKMMLLHNTYLYHVSFWWL